MSTRLRLLTGLLVAGVCGACGDRWDRNFDPTEEEPHGMSLLPQLLQTRFPEAEYGVLEGGFGESLGIAEQSLPAGDAGGEVYVAVGPGLAYDSAEVVALTDYVRRGGRALLASHELSIELTRAMLPGDCLGEAYDVYQVKTVDQGDTLLTNRGEAIVLAPVTQRRGGEDYAMALRTADYCPDRLNVLLEIGHGPGPGVTIGSGEADWGDDADEFDEDDLPDDGYHDWADTLDALPEGIDIEDVIGVRSRSRRRTPVMTEVPLGEGHFLLLGAPVLLTDAYLLDTANRAAVEAVLSYVGPDVRRIRLDEERRSSQWEVELANRPVDEDAAPPPERETLLREVFKRPALAAAWYLLLGGALVFVLFGAKRIQRIVPVRQPRRNTTLAYLGNVSRLYLARPNNVLMARKQLGLFEAFCQRKFGLRPVHDPADRPRLAELRGVDPRLVESLARYQNSLASSQGLSNDAFLRLMHILRMLYQQLGRRAAAPSA